MARLLLLASLFAAATTSLPSQGPPTFLPKPHLMRVAAEDVPALLQRLPETMVGKVLAEPEVAAAFAAGLAKYRAMAQRRLAVATATEKSGIRLDPWMRSNIAIATGLDLLRAVAIEDMQRVELAVMLGEDGSMPRGDPALALVFASKPRAEGRWTALFDQRARQFATSPDWTLDPEGKFAGFPASIFARKDANEEHGYQPGGNTFYVHLPGTFVVGMGKPDQCGTHGPSPARPPAQVGVEFDVAAYIGMFTALMGGVPTEVRALGFDSLQQLRWRLQFQGTRVLDEIEVVVNGEPTGAIGAILGGKAALPAQALPETPLLQLRCTIDVALLVTAVEGMVGSELPDAVTDGAKQAFTGGIAIGVSAPAKGGVIPRVYLSLGIADDKAVDALLDLVGKQGKTKPVTYESVPCTVLAIDGGPAAFQPTWFRRDGVLHIAESALSMRAFVKAQDPAVVAMDVGDAPIPEGAGELLTNLDLRWDERAIYEAFHKNWLPLVNLLPMSNQLLGTDAMPSPEAVGPLLGKGRGVLRRQGNTWVLQQLGGLGGVELAGVAMTWGPLLSDPFHNDYAYDEMDRQLAEHQLEQVWTALEAFQKANQRWPHDLGELVTAQKLAPDALLRVGDTEGEVVPMPAGSPAVRSSYRYFAPPLAKTVNGNDVKLLLVAIAPQHYNRPMLTDTGTTPDNYGPDCLAPIEKFAK